MSKTTTSAPSYASIVKINSVPKSSVSASDGILTTDYNMNEAEKKAYDYAQSEFAKNLENVNVFSKDTLKSLNEQVEAYKQQGINTIKEVYTPILKNLQNDIASRFGNLDNSVFLDKLSSIENKRAESMNALAQDVSAKKQEVVQNELANRYDYLNFLNNYQNQAYQNALSLLGLNGNLSTKAASTSSGNSSLNNLSNQLAKVALLMGNTIL